jgi:hypothetical protein
MQTYYYIDKNGQKQGPFSAEELSERGVTSDTLIWQEGMNDWQTAGSISELSTILKMKISKMEILDTEMAKSPFFNFTKPYFDYIGKGKIFSLIYIINVLANLIFPFVIMYIAINSGFFREVEEKFIIILMWLVIVFSCWVGALLWWDRRKKINNIGSSEFIAIPIFSDILQTAGEWLGTMIAIISAGCGLLASLFLGKNTDYFFINEIGQFGILGVIIGPIIGYVIIITFRFLAEQLRLFAAFANNTKEIAQVLKNNKIRET